jgi:hypothetical protein
VILLPQLALQAAAPGRVVGEAQGEVDVVRRAPGQVTIGASTANISRLVVPPPKTGVSRMASTCCRKPRRASRARKGRNAMRCTTSGIVRWKRASSSSLSCGALLLLIRTSRPLGSRRRISPRTASKSGWYLMTFCAQKYSLASSGRPRSARAGGATAAAGRRKNVGTVARRISVSV